MGFTIRRDAKKLIDYIARAKTKEEIKKLTHGIKPWWKCVEDLNDEFPEFDNDSANTWFRRFTASLFCLSEEGAVQREYIDRFLPKGLGAKMAKLKIKDATRKASNGEAFTENDLEKIYNRYVVKVEFKDFEVNTGFEQQSIKTEEPVPIQTESDDRLHRDAIDMLEIMKIMAADMAAMLASMKKQEKYQQDTNDFLRKLV